ncbi:MAG: LysM peptidoglycan-binding domain-containing protein [Firmicutes bacterium]|nr:LysM peptidoglycan-binding domain-containing protein [Bacillota bacterium]
MTKKHPINSRFYLFLLPLLLLVLVSGETIAQTYRVRPGDSLFLISRNFGTSINALKSANGLTSNIIYPGQTLTIPGGNTSSYTVQPGDSLFLIAQRYNLSLNELRQANNIWHDTIWPGQTIYIPRSANPGGGNTVYTVRPNDTLFLLARRYGSTVQEIKSLNNLWSDTIYPGQKLTIPSGGKNPGGNTGSGNFSATDLELLARLVRAEAEGEPYEGQVAVAAAVLNRVRDSRYPGTIAGVIYQVVNGRYQFCPVSDGRINLPSTASSRRAVQDALNGWDPTHGAIGFYNPVTASNSWVRQQQTTAVIGNHVFYK